MINRLATTLLLSLSTLGCSLHSPTPNSLYYRLGSMEGINTIVGVFTANCVGDPRINRYFLAVASNPDRLTTFKNHLVDHICQDTGGPCAYSGRDMKSAHAGLGISDQDFNVLVENLVKALDKAEVIKADQETLLGILGPLRRDIVENHS